MNRKREKIAGTDKDWYPRYRQFERRFHEHCIEIARVDWVREYYSECVSIMTREEFSTFLESLSERRRWHLQRKWERGFDAWLRTREQRDARLVRKIQEWGCPVEIEVLAKETYNKYRRVN